MCIETPVCGSPPTKPSRLVDSGGDRISNLHESIISQVLSRLPTKDAVGTCVLSKDWEKKWLLIDNLEISDAAWDAVPQRNWNYDLTYILYCVVSGDRLLNGKTTSLVNIMERVLLTNSVKSFTLYCWQEYDLGSMAAWISAIMGHNIETFKLLYPHKGLVLPQSLLKCTSLRNLELKLHCTFIFPTDNCFYNLIDLSFHSVEIFNEHFNNETLILNFPVLKTCQLYHCTWLNVKFVEIYAPALTTFKLMTSYAARVDDPLIKILGAKLATFETRDSLNFVLTGTTVASANLFCFNRRFSKDFGLRARKLVKEVATVKYLILSGDMIGAITHAKQEFPLPSFDRLEWLHIWENGSELEGLLELLHAAPFLKLLKCNVTEWSDTYDYDALEPGPSCVVSFLEEVTLKCHVDRYHQFKLEKFLLKNGTQLKKVFVTSPCFPADELVKQLSTFPKASTSLDIVAIPWNLEYL